MSNCALANTPQESDIVQKASPTRTIHNIGYNFLGALVPLCVTLLTVPIYLHVVGIARYGVILVAWSMLGYFGFMDLGLSRATTHALAKIAHTGEAEAKAHIFWSSAILNCALGLIGCAILWVIGSILMGHVLKIDPSIYHEAIASVPWIAAMLPLALMFGVGVGAVEAHDRFGTLNVIQSAGLILGQILPLAAVSIYGPSLNIIMPIMFSVRLVTTTATFYLALKVQKINFRPVLDFTIVKSLFGYGGWVTLTNLISPLMTSADQFVIGSIRNVNVVPFYAVPLNIVSRTLIVPSTICRSLFPALARNEDNGRKNIVSKALLSMTLVMTLIYIVAILTGHLFLQAWLGTDIANKGSMVFRILCVGAWANSFGFVLFTALQGQGRPKIIAKLHTAEVVPYLILLYYSVKYFGIEGAAFAWTARVTIDASILAFFSKLDNKCFTPLVSGAIAVGLSFILANIIGTEMVLSVVAALGISSAFLIFSARTNDAFSDFEGFLRDKINIRVL